MQQLSLAGRFCPIEKRKRRDVLVVWFLKPHAVLHLFGRKPMAWLGFDEHGVVLG